MKLSYLGVVLCLLGFNSTNIFGDTNPPGTTYYVATNGNDANPGTLESPFGTLNTAASKLKAGDNLLIRGGIYYQTMYCGASGTPGLPITIAGFPGEMAIIDGVYTNPASSWGALVSVNGSNTSVQQVTIRRSNWMGLSLKGAYDQAIGVTSEANMENGILASETGHDSLVQGCSVHENAKSNENFQNTRGGWSSGLSAARGANNCTLRGNIVWGNWGEGVSTYEASYTLIESNTIYNNQLNLYLSDTTHSIARGNLIYSTPSNNPCANSDQMGIGLGDETSNPASSDNMVVNNLLLGNQRNIYSWLGGKRGGLVNVTIAFNTCANSSRDTNLKILSGKHSNTLVANNIFLQEDTLPVAIVPATQGITYSHNLWSKTPPSIAAGPGDVTADPQLLKIGTLAPGLLSSDWFLYTQTSPGCAREPVHLPALGQSKVLHHLAI